jgi:hypothetical protein
MDPIVELAPVAALLLAEEPPNATSASQAAS